MSFDNHQAELIFYHLLQDLEDSRRAHVHDYDINDLKRPEVPEDDEDISQYKFAKFAATYFQANNNHSFKRGVLKTPLLPLKNEGDQLVRPFHDQFQENISFLPMSF